jgi:hypothetical protein
MKNSITKLGISATGVLVMGATSLAVNSDLQKGVNNAKPGGTPADLDGAGGVFSTAANILIYLTGAIAVIVVVYGGLRYVTSTGDASRVKQAKDTIVYGITGLVIALLAYAIVNFITNNLK